MMNDRKRLSIKVVAVLVLLAIFLIGALFYTQLMPPLNKTQADANPQKLPPISAVGVAVEAHEKAIARADNSTALRAGSNTAVLGASTSGDLAIICQDSDAKISPLQKKICKNLSANIQARDSVTVPVINRQIHVGENVGSKAKDLSQKLEKLINSID